MVLQADRERVKSMPPKLSVTRLVLNADLGRVRRRRCEQRTNRLPVLGGLLRDVILEELLNVVRKRPARCGR